MFSRGDSNDQNFELFEIEIMQILYDSMLIRTLEKSNYQTQLEKKMYKV